MKIVISLILPGLIMWTCLMFAEAARSVCDSTPTPETTLKEVSLRKVQCESDGLFANVSCHLYSKNRTHKHVFITIYVFENLYPLIRLKHWLKTSSNNYQPGLYDVRVDVCDVAQQMYSKGHNFGRFFMDNAVPNWQTNYGHLFHTCPYKKGLFVLNSTVTGLPCKSVYETGIYFGKFSKNTDSKLDIGFYPTNDKNLKKPSILITLYDTVA